MTFYFRHKFVLFFTQQQLLKPPLSDTSYFFENIDDSMLIKIHYIQTRGFPVKFLRYLQAFTLIMPLLS